MGDRRQILNGAMPTGNVKRNTRIASWRRWERAIPGLRDHILELDLATPITMHRYTLNHMGAANGWSYSRVENWKKEVPFVKGLYHVGHWTGPSGIHGCIGSGSTAAKLILRRYKA